MSPGHPEMTAPTAAATIFGGAIDSARHYVELLRTSGIERGLLGPREVGRIWDRHVLNSAALADLVPHGARVVDVGSGAGLPGVPLTIARADLDMVLLEPMARRVQWLTEVVDELALPVAVVRGRAEERDVRQSLGLADVVAARAVAPLARLASWCLPLVRPGGVVLAIKGAMARNEVDRDRSAVSRLGGTNLSVVECGAGVLDVPTTVVTMTRARGPTSNRPSRRKK